MLVGAYTVCSHKVNRAILAWTLRPFAAGAAITLIHAFLCITLMCNQVVSGLAMVLTGYGLSALLGRSVTERLSPE